MTRMPSRFQYRSILFLLILILVLLSPPAHADGGYYYTTVVDAEASRDAMGAQRALFLQTPEAMEMILQSSYRGTADDFAWVLPLPAVPKAVADEPVETLDQLESITRPIFLQLEEHYDSDGDCYYCDGDTADGSTTTVGDAQQSDVSVVLEGELEFLDYVILDARTGQGLEDWLDENGFIQPEGSAAILADYLERDFVFFAAKLNINATSENEMQGLPAVRFTFDLDVQPVYPMKLTALSAVEPVRVLIMVASTFGGVEPDPERSIKWAPINDYICSVDQYTDWLEALWDRDGASLLVGEMMETWNPRYKRVQYDPFTDTYHFYRDCSYDDYYKSTSTMETDVCVPTLTDLTETLYQLFRIQDEAGRQTLPYSLSISRFLGQFRPDQMDEDITFTATHNADGYRANCLTGVTANKYCDEDRLEIFDSIGERSCSGYYSVHINSGKYSRVAYDCYTGYSCIDGRCTSDDEPLRCGIDDVFRYRDGVWVEEENCEVTCLNGECVECHDTERACVGYDDVQYCRDGAWVDYSTCWSGTKCKEGYCQYACLPEEEGDIRCNSYVGISHEEICEDGFWISRQCKIEEGETCVGDTETGACTNVTGICSSGESSVCLKTDGHVYSIHCSGYHTSYWCDTDFCEKGFCLEKCAGDAEGHLVCRRQSTGLIFVQYECDGQQPQVLVNCNEDSPECWEEFCDDILPPGASSQTDDAADSGCAQSPRAAGWGWLLLVTFFAITRRNRRHPMSR